MRDIPQHSPPSLQVNNLKINTVTTCHDEHLTAEDLQNALPVFPSPYIQTFRYILC